MWNQSLRVLAWALCLASVLMTASGRAELAEEAVEDPAFGKLMIYQAADEPKGVLLFVSGVGGWNAELAAVARELAKLDYVVAGVDLDLYLSRLERAESPCSDPAADFDRLNRVLEQRYPIATHQPPILLGFAAGATLTYAALAQGPDERFHAGVGVNFCPQWPLRKPVCAGAATVETTALPETKGLVLKPARKLPVTWFVFQNQPACEVQIATQFVQAVALARVTDIPGAGGSKAWLPQVSALLQWLDPGIARQVQPDSGVSGVPLIEAPVTGGPKRAQLAVLFSGDGGWALLDRAVTAELAKNGLATVGWDSLSYFWKARQPEEVALDLERTLRHYLEAWTKERIVLIGYSFGADVLPATINRLAKDLRERIDLVALLGLSERASFEFRLTHWISDEPDEGDQPVRPELEKLVSLKRFCLYGAEEPSTLCPQLTNLGVVVEQMPGDHHFDEDYPGVAQRILSQLPPLSSTPAPSAVAPPAQGKN